jgi:outer membrane protein TolC
MKRALSIAAALAVLVPIPASAEETRPIDLATAIDIALKQNDTYLGEAVDADIAAANVYAAHGADDLILEGSAGALVREVEPTEGPFFQETSTESIGASLGLWKPLSTGGRVGLSVRDDITRTEARIAAGAPGTMPLDIEYTVHGPRAELVFVQPLLRGRGKVAAHAQRRIAAADRDAQIAERERAKAALVRDVTAMYWELAYAEREVEIAQSSLALAREQLDVTRARADVGKGSELEVLAVEQAIAAREAQLLQARQLEDERALELRVLLAQDDGDPRAYAASESLDGAAPAPATDKALERALRFSPDLHVIAEQARAAAVQREAARNELLPTLDLVVRGGPAGNADDAGDAFAQMGQFDSYAAQATLTFSIPLGNRAAKGRVASSRLREKRLAHAGAEVRGHLTAAVQRALDALDLAAQRIVVAEKAAELARRNVDLQVARWKTGAGTNFDVLERQDELAAADAALARARADHRIAAAGLVYLTGD